MTDIQRTNIVSFKTRFVDFARLYNLVNYRSLFDSATPEFGIRKITQEKQGDTFLPTIQVELEIVRGTFGDIQTLIAKEINDGGMAASTLRSETSDKSPS